MEFVQSMIDRFPEMRNIYQSHISSNAEELLPHVFFGDVTRFWLSVYQQGRAGNSQAFVRLKDFMGFLENAFVHGDEYVTNLIVVSFLENLPWTGQDNEEIREFLGPILKDELSKLESWKPG